jgi:hypothetical protein
MLTKEKELAIKLRKEGKTYSEILEQVHVAKSTLTEWFKSVQLAVPQKQRITQLRINAQLKGAASRKSKRISEVEELIRKGKADVGKITDRELWLIGVALYWAEGSKQKEKYPSVGIAFTNSDPQMLALFLRWLKLLKISDDDLAFELYVHDNRKKDIPEFKKWWTEQLHIPIKKLSTVYFKRDKIKTNRTNTKDLYHGLIRIKVASSTVLNRKINGWISGIVTQ